MVCKSNAFVGASESNKRWSNWNGDVAFKAGEYFEPSHSSDSGAPDGLLQLVHVVARATKEKRRLHAIGSGWAFENIAASDAWVVSLKNLSRRLDNVVNPTSGALTDEWRDKQLAPAGSSKLVHVEAGIELGALNELLDKDGLSMPTLGGSNGQSLAGAISTSTHGGDWEKPPLPDFVRAIHLVTEGGREVWIERDTDRITKNNNLLMSVLTCPDTEVIRDDDVFNSTVVSFGRFGVIYSFILEVRRAFRVVEVVIRPDRAKVLQALRDGLSSGPVFDPLFTLLSETPPPSNLAERDGVIATAKPYSFQILFSSQNPEDCWAHRRWETTESADLPAVDPLLVTGTVDLDGPAVLLIAETAFIAAAGLAIGIPFVGPVFALELLALAADMGLRAAGQPLTFGAAVALALNAAWKLPFVGNAIPGITYKVLAGQFDRVISEGRRGPYHLITSGKRGSQSADYRSDSIEIIFDAATASYLDFLNVLLPTGPAYKQSGYVSVRPSRMSRAELSMHNVAGGNAISIEVATIKGLDDNADWMKFVESLALSFGGRPHWGQINKLTEQKVLVLYDKHLMKWREALVRVSANGRLFSNRFTRRRGLEPRGMMREVTGVNREKRLKLPLGRVTHLLGEGAAWSPVSIQQAVREIESGAVIYFTGGAGREAIVHVAKRGGRKYLRTGPDGVGENNLE